MVDVKCLLGQKKTKQKSDILIKVKHPVRARAENLKLFVLELKNPQELNDKPANMAVYDEIRPLKIQKRNLLDIQACSKALNVIYFPHLIPNLI